jgi:hypothetical protein
MPLDVETLLNFNFDFPGFSFSGESWAMKTYLDNIEKNIFLAAKDFEEKSHKKLKAEEMNYEKGELAYEYHEVEIACETHIPRFFRNSAVIMLWALFESYVKDLARYIKKRDNHSVSINDLKGKNPVDGFIKYFDFIVGVDLNWDSAKVKSLIELGKLRNHLAHCNGRLESASEKVIQDANELAKIDGIEIQEDCLIVTKEYLEQAKEMVLNTLETLVVKVHKRYYKPKQA